MSYFGRPKGSLEIPLKDSVENALHRRVSDFCTGIWNLTQQWEKLNGESAALLETIANDRLRLKYARYGHSDFQAATKLTPVGDQLHAESEVVQVQTQAEYRLSNDKRKALLCSVISNSERIVEIVEEELGLISSKLRGATGQLRALMQLVDSASSPESDSMRTSSYKIQQMLDILPPIAAMYSEELAAKRAVISDLANFEDSSMFTAMIASWTQQPFIEKSLLSRLYALVV